MTTSEITLHAKFSFHWYSGKVSTSGEISVHLKQVAQLSQTDCAAGWVSYGEKWKTGTGRQYLRTLERIRDFVTIVLYKFTFTITITITIRPIGHRSIFNHCDVIGQQSNRIRCKKRKLVAITPFKVIQGHRGRYQSKGRMRLPIY